MAEPQFRSGFAAIIGRANVGKSTLLNRFVGAKVAIVSDKPQTTRHRIQAILTRPEAQIIFIDTPGWHEARHRLGEYMQRTAQSVIGDVDVVLFVVDASRGVTSWDRLVARRLKGREDAVVLVVNKMDLIPEEQEVEILEEMEVLGDFRRVFPLSAVEGDGPERLVEELIDQLPPGPRYFPEDWVTDRPEQFLVGELIREQVLRHTEEEVPHAVGVMVEEMRPRDNADLVDVRATVIVDRESQKGILIGRGGRMLKRIGSDARQDIEGLLGSQIYLQLWVKAKPGWRDRPGSLQEMGYR